MKRLIGLLGIWLACSLALPAAAQEAADAPWQQANTAYINGDYRGAAELYEQLVAQGYVSDRLFYNLGNAYFKGGELGEAIQNYNKALKLRPYDRDIAYNLAVANSRVKDKIDVVPEFFLSRWIQAWRSSLDSNAWAVLSLVLLALMLGGLLLFLLADRTGWRRTGFFAGVCFGVFFAVTVVFAAVERHEQTDASEAIVLAQAASVKSAPEADGSDIFLIHEGTKVTILSEYDGWTEIMIADGNKGWVTSETIAAIAY